jgi:cytochrome oxidase Cu insertion factor (SCO1/SenC/PrrC family)
VAKVDITELEPADRDPVQLRRTALILLGIMLVGGVMIMAAYLVKRQQDLQEDRPALRGRLQKNLALVNDRKETVTLGQLEGKVWLVTQVSLSQREEMQRAVDALRWLEGELPEQKDVRFVLLAVDPNRDVPEELAKFRAELGVGEQWWLAGAGEGPIRGYLKKEMKMGEVRVDESGKIEFDSMVLLVDRHLHLRPAYNFNRAWAVEDAARRLLEEEPERAEEFYRDFGVRPEAGLGQVEKLREAMKKDVLHVLGEDLTSEEEKSS